MEVTKSTKIFSFLFLKERKRRGHNIYEIMSQVSKTFLVSARHPIYRDVELEFDLRDLKTTASGKRDAKVDDDRRLSNGTKTHIPFSYSAHRNDDYIDRVSAHTTSTI